MVLTKGATNPQTAAWLINDNNDVWKITVTDYATGQMITRYLITVGDALTHQDVLNIYSAQPAFLAEALNLRQSIPQPTLT